MIVLDKFRGGRELVPGRELVHHHYSILTINLYYRPFLPQTENTSERAVGLQIEAFVLDF